VHSATGDRLIDKDGSKINIGVEEEGLKITVKDGWDKRYTTYFVEGNEWQGYGFLHYNGVAVTKPVFEKVVESEWNLDGIWDFAIVWRNGKVGVYKKCMDPIEKSKLVIDTKLDTIEITPGDYGFIRFKVQIGELWGLADKEGQLRIPIEYEDIIYNYANTRSLVKDLVGWGIYDEHDGMIMEPWLDSVIIGDGYSDRKSNGIVVGESFGIWGAWNWDGELLGEVEYDSFVKFLRNQSLWKNAAIFSKKGKLYRVNKNGDVSRYKETED